MHVLQTDSTTYMTTLITSYAKDVIQDHVTLQEEKGEDIPLFLVLTYPNVHHPIE